MMYVYRGRYLVATIQRQSRLAAGFNAAEPWLMTHVCGRIDRFSRYDEAAREARKSYPSAQLRRH